MAKVLKPLKEKDIDKRLTALSGWEVNKKKTELYRTFEQPNFVTGLSFIAKVAVHAEVNGHHPDIELSYDKVKVRLTTHDAKGLTKKDFELAEKVGELR